MKRILRLFAATALVVFLGACSDGSGSGNPDTETDNPGSQTGGGGGDYHLFYSLAEDAEFQAKEVGEITIPAGNDPFLTWYTRSGSTLKISVAQYATVADGKKFFRITDRHASEDWHTIDINTGTNLAQKNTGAVYITVTGNTVSGTSIQFGEGERDWAPIGAAVTAGSNGAFTLTHRFTQAQIRNPSQQRYRIRVSTGVDFDIHNITVKTQNDTNSDTAVEPTPFVLGDFLDVNWINNAAWQTAQPVVGSNQLSGVLQGAGGTWEWIDNNDGTLSLKQTGRDNTWHGLDLIFSELNFQAGDTITIMGRVSADKLPEPPAGVTGNSGRSIIVNTNLTGLTEMGGVQSWLNNREDAVEKQRFTLTTTVGAGVAGNIRIQANSWNTGWGNSGHNHGVTELIIDSISFERR